MNFTINGIKLARQLKPADLGYARMELGERHGRLEALGYWTILATEAQCFVWQALWQVAAFG